MQDSLEKLAKNRTTFVIAHRLSTIKNAQRILVLTEEGIAEEGTHEELLEKGGVYEKLYQMQFHKIRVLCRREVYSVKYKSFMKSMQNCKRGKTRVK